MIRGSTHSLEPTNTRMAAAQELESLLSRLGQRDRAAIEEIARRYYPTVERLVRESLRGRFGGHNKWLLGAFATGDLVNEVFLSVLPHLDNLEDRTESGLTGYLANAVRNQLIDAIRFEQAACRDVRRRPNTDDRSTPTDFVAPNATPSYHVAIHDHLRLYREALHSMSEAQRRLIVLRIEDELPFAAIADELDYASADSARQAFNAAKATLLVRLHSRGVSPTVHDAPADRET